MKFTTNHLLLIIILETYTLKFSSELPEGLVAYKIKYGKRSDKSVKEEWTKQLGFVASKRPYLSCIQRQLLTFWADRDGGIVLPHF